MRNRGDTADIVLDYTVDGEPITEGQFDEIEVYLGNSRYLLSEGAVMWDAEIQKYRVFVNQADSLKFKNPIEYQVRFRIGTKVVSTDTRNKPLGKTISNEEI